MILSIIIYLYILSIWAFFFSSAIWAAVVLLIAVIASFIYQRKYYLRHDFLPFLIALVFSTTLIVILKTLAIYDIFFTSYRVTNTIEHLNLMLSLCLVSWYGIQTYVKESKWIVIITPLLAFSFSVLLEIIQYFYREYFDLVSWKSHGLYNDSMIDLSVNILGALIFTVFIFKVFWFQKQKNTLQI